MGKREFVLAALGFAQSQGLSGNANAQIPNIFQDDQCQIDANNPSGQCQDTGCAAQGGVCDTQVGMIQNTQVNGCFCDDPLTQPHECADQFDPAGAPICVDFECAQDPVTLLPTGNRCDESCNCVPITGQDCTLNMGICQDTGCAANTVGYHCDQSTCTCQPDVPPPDDCQVDAAGDCQDNGCAANNPGFHCDPLSCQCQQDDVPIDECQVDAVGVCRDNGCGAKGPNFHCNPDTCQCEETTPPIDECQLAAGVCQDNGCAANSLPGEPRHCDPVTCQCQLDDPPIDECQVDAVGVCQDNGCAANNPGFRCDPDACQCLPDPNGPTTVLDHFKCWQVKDLKNPKFEQRGVTLDDQFADETVAVKKLFLICAPADKDGSGINDPDTHQCCYKIKGSKLNPPVRVEVTDQFGTHQAEVKKAKFLCQPCSKTLLP